jgi:hypothetical protein
MERELIVSRSPEVARLGALRVGVGKAGIPISGPEPPRRGGPGLFALIDSHAQTEDRHENRPLPDL